MRTSLRLRRAMVAVIALTAVIAGLTVNADAAIPRGSAAEAMFETGPQGVLGDPGYALVDGWWGHEGGHHTGTTFFSLNLADSHGVVTTASVAAVHAALPGAGQNFQNLRVAFVRASSDGSAERPLVHAGEVAGDAFQWWTDLGMGSGVPGSGNGIDAGTFVSTQSQWTAFWHAGRPVQAFDTHLVLHDISDGAVSATPEGTSIMDAWPAGTKISVVLYVSDGYNDELEPVVKVGPDGRAISAWLTLETVAKPGTPQRSSAGYRVLTASRGEGSQLVDGLPPASAKYDPVASGSTSASTAAKAGSSSAGASGAAGAAAGTVSTGSGTAASSGSGSGSSTGWLWIVVVVLLIAGCTSVLVFRRVRRQP